ncbi:MAG TPA: alpha/beta fold hydrolase [Gammaproteobacteria bacterium]
MAATQTFKAFCLMLATGIASTTPAPAGAVECVILVHGLNRSEHSMVKLQAALQAEGYATINVAYPSRTKTVDELAGPYIEHAVADCRKTGAEQIHFVTHSMGGILVRYYLAHEAMRDLGRVVMLGPPNQGSEVVDALKDVPGFETINGPAGRQLGTDAASLSRQLGPVTYPVGVIAGNRSINLLLSLMIPGEDDGKVSVERAKVEGMMDFLVVPHTHPLIMNSEQVIHQTCHFLRRGTFEKAMAESADAG